MQQCTVTGNYLLSYNTCQKRVLTVVLTVSTGSISYNRRPDLDGPCGQAYYYNGNASITEAEIDGASLSVSGYTGMVWIGLPNVSCTATAPKYDCINSACTAKSIYNTPGFYNSLEECEQACGSGCSGKCISNSEWAQIEGLANQLKNKNCS
jgi:hypothetical protein